MIEEISETLIIGNSLISTNREYMTKGQVYHYCNIVDSLLPEGYYTTRNNNSFSDFCEEYSFLVKRFEDKMMINCEKYLLERYFRTGVSEEIIKVFDMAGDELNKIEGTQTNYDVLDLEFKDEVITTNKSEKILSKSLTK